MLEFILENQRPSSPRNRIKIHKSLMFRYSPTKWNRKI